ncbi:uncharacterized protein Tco025E_01013 [Trypanosoma conorhini]|uniref:PDZ domain-containing protein n=1 Tax=Trypanosoma conorhini TaxID=83891 RepID=A0A422Q9Z3_9TRYP|nr:uncharacterized protein Tco025E_01013 [Trypanosoma conorhini]RNF26778.1 hypothetical protein Tco025E_01013 [Trypanosoma conorhini]
MLFAMEQRPITGPVDEFTTTRNILTQLQNFFEQHSFDTCGPYSDLFSVLLSCCKHLVDTNLHHHAILVTQRREVTRLASETQALCDLSARCQADLHELKSPSLEPRLAERRERTPLRSDAASHHASCAEDGETPWGGLDEFRRHLHETQMSVAELRRRQEEVEQRLLEEHRRNSDGIRQLRQLEESIDGLRRDLSAHAECVDGEVTRMKKLVAAASAAASPVERVSAMTQYTDKKVDALRSELCLALRETVLDNQVGSPNSPVIQPCNGGVAGAMPTAMKRTDGNDGEAEVRHDDFASGLRRLVSATSGQIATQMEKLESRIEALEVYAPHYCAMAARPPLLGVELRDEKGIGVRIDKVFRSFAGEAAGMMPGDVVIGLNGQSVLTRADMYAVMTELVREHQSRCRVLRQLYFKQHMRQEKSVGVLMNRGHGFNFPVSSESATTTPDLDSCWELPRLELRFHLKRGGVLREVVLVVEADSDSL